MKRKPLSIHIALSFLHVFGVFFLPLSIIFLSAIIFGASEVSSSFSVFLLISLIFILPSFLSILISTTIKVRREALHQAKLPPNLREPSTLYFYASAIHRHAKILTVRGWATLIGGIIFVLVSMEVRWASFGTTATFLLLLLYMILGFSSFVSAFMVRSLRTSSINASGVHREVVPAVVVSGEIAEERFVLRRVPVPMGFILLIEDDNPDPLETKSRYAAAAAAVDGIVTLRGAFRKTPRGCHKLGPANLWYQDALGLTRISVASMSTTMLKCLPRFRPVHITQAPYSSIEEPDILCVPHRFPTEDFFRFKEYYPGDDTRRIHWGLSIRTGNLQLRVPESKERSIESILLVLDSYLFNIDSIKSLIGIEDMLTAVIEVWLSLADKLYAEGHKVQIAAAADNGLGAIHLEVMSCVRSSSAQWQDLGARIRWQGDFDIDSVASHFDSNTHLVVVSSRIHRPPPVPDPKSLTWVYLDPNTILKDEPGFFKGLLGTGFPAFLKLLRVMFKNTHPTGSEENIMREQIKNLRFLHSQYKSRKFLRDITKKSSDIAYQGMIAQSPHVYLLEEKAGMYHLNKIGRKA